MLYVILLNKKKRKKKKIYIYIYDCNAHFQVLHLVGTSI